MLKNNSAHTRLSILSELYKLCFGLTMFGPFNKSLNPFPIYPTKYKEMRCGSRLLYCIGVVSLLALDFEMEQ